MDKLFNWQPGVTAPRDGTSFLVRIDGKVFFSRWFDTGGGLDEVSGEWCRLALGVEVAWRNNRTGLRIA